MVSWRKEIYHHLWAEKLGCTNVPNLFIMFPVVHKTNNFFFFSKLKLIFVTAQVLVQCWILFGWLVVLEGGCLSKKQ